jgi:MFS-type transporter involved in bile tolerance (Atg22 family)
MNPNKNKAFNDGTQEIQSREDFSNYVQSLLQDFEKNGDTWENNSLSSFLAAIAVYTKGINGYYQSMGIEASAETATWRIFAQILKGASVYE